MYTKIGIKNEKDDKLSENQNLEFEVIKKK